MIDLVYSMSLNEPSGGINDKLFSLVKRGTSTPAEKNKIELESIKNLTRMETGVKLA